MPYSFNSIQEFKKFVYQLDFSDIQNFSYEKWNKLYKAINNLFETLDIDTLKKNYKNKNPKCNIDDLSDRGFFTNCICLDEFVKLNSNFKLKENDWLYCQSIAKKIAQDTYNDIDLATVLVSKNNKEKMVYFVDRASLKATKYAEKYKNAFDFMPSNINILEEKYMPSKGTAVYKTFNTNIEIYDMTDGIYNTSVHEAIHAHFQQNTSLQEYIKESNNLPFGLDKNLSDLFENNQNFYLLGDYNFLGYARQPIEYFAKLIGNLAEKEFRKITNQHSERNFILLNNYFTQLLDIENPVSAKYNNDVIDGFYPISSFSKINKFRKELPLELKEKIKFYKNNNLVKIAIQRGYLTGDALLKHIKSKENKKLMHKSTIHSLLKKVPIVGIGVGTYLTIKRILKSDDAIISSSELLSGALSSLNKGIGTFYSFCIDLALYNYDKACLKASRGFYNNVVFKRPPKKDIKSIIIREKNKEGI